MSTQETDIKRVLRNSVIVVILMFGFGFALIPIYNTVCKWLGINGQIDPATQSFLSQVKLDKSRKVTVEFFSTVNTGLNWKFKALQPKVVVHPGQQTKVVYVATNLAGTDTHGLAKFNIHPPGVGRYFKKTECFCFTQQKLKKGETRKMPLVFMVDPKMPRRFKNIVLTYEFVPSDKKVAKK